MAVGCNGGRGSSTYPAYGKGAREEKCIASSILCEGTLIGRFCLAAGGLCLRWMFGLLPPSIYRYIMT